MNAPALAMDTAISDGAAVVAGAVALAAAPAATDTPSAEAKTETQPTLAAKDATSTAPAPPATSTGDTATAASGQAATTEVVAAAPATTAASATKATATLAAPVSKTVATTQAPARPAFGEAPSPAGSLGGTVFALLLVVGLILGLAWLARRMPGMARGASSNGLRVVASMAIGARERIMVVEVGQTQLLLGVGPGGTRTLHTLDEPLPAAAPPTVPPFAQLLAQQFGKKA